MSETTDLADALAALESAMASFSAAYERWLRENGHDGELRQALDVAEARLDAARSALARVQEALR